MTPEYGQYTDLVSHDSRKIRSQSIEIFFKFWYQFSLFFTTVDIIN